MDVTFKLLKFPLVRIIVGYRMEGNLLPEDESYEQIIMPLMNSTDWSSWRGLPETPIQVSLHDLNAGDDQST